MRPPSDAPHYHDRVATPATRPNADDRRDAVGLLAGLTDLALRAPDVPSAVAPALESLVERTAAAGSAFFQLDGTALAYRARAAAGRMPAGPAMDAIAAHGLPADTPLMRALENARAPVFLDDTRTAPEAAGFPRLGVASLAAAPVRRRDGSLLGAFLMHTFEPHAWTPDEARVFGAVAGTLAALAGRLAAEEEAEAARESALRALGLAMEARDRETAGHTDRVTALAVATGRALGLSGQDLKALRWGAYLHDAGKLAVPDAVLLKPGKLDEAEWTLMREHPRLGHHFASALGFLPPDALAVVLHHHERWDGTGYPHGLPGAAIPRAARVFAACDVYDALVSERPYKEAWSREAALAELRAQGGRHLDPAVVAAFERALASRDAA